jgi:hypothetical protein
LKFSKTSIALLVIHLAIVSSVAVKYLYQRSTCPRVWARAEAYDPDLVMRGRYLSLQLTVDGCGSTLPSAKQAQFPRNVNGLPTGGRFSIWSPGTIRFPANLEVKDNKLIATRIPETDGPPSGQEVAAFPGAACDTFRLVNPVDFYIPEHATDPSWPKQGDELWIEVTVPPNGPPRPTQLAIRQSGTWKPLAFQ